MARLLRYMFTVLAAISAAVSIASAQQPSTAQSSIGYPSVAAALQALQHKSGVNIVNQGGWTVIDDPSEQTIWSFTPPGHPAYPAAVRRQIVKGDSGFSLKMSILCQAAKQPCDKLVADFQELNNKMRENINRSHAP
jgi:hypothetical protein